MSCALWSIGALFLFASLVIAALAWIAYVNWCDEEDEGDEHLGVEAGRLEVGDGDA